MSEHFLSNKYSWFINSLLLIFPIVINLQKVAGDLILFILAITGLFITFFYKTSPFSIKELRLFNWLVLGYFAVICISILFSGKALELVHFISRELYFLFAPFVALAIFKAKVNISVVLYGIKISLLVMAVLVYLNVGSFDIRYSGSMNADPYGLIAAVLTLFSITRICKENSINQIITFIAFIAGILVVISSGTRSAWIALFVSILLYIWIVFLNKEFKCYFKFVAVFIVAVFISVNFMKFDNIQNRVLSAKIQVVDWFSDRDSTSSVGIRLEMWDASIKQLINKHPLTGMGYRNNINTTIAKYADKESRHSIERFTHVHNTYLNHLLAEGFPGLIAIMSLLFIPFKIFFLKVKGNVMADNSRSRMGVILVLSFIVYGFANKLFGDIFINAFYVFYIAILLPKVAKVSKY